MKKLKPIIIILTLILGFSFTTLRGQTGVIKGVVTDKTNSETLIGTTIVIEGTTTGVTSDIAGNFLIPNVRPGTYSLKVSYVSYNTKVIGNVKVEPGKTTDVKIELEQSMVALGDITVTAIRKTNTEISMITDIRANPFVSTGISGQQISRTLDKDASEVVKRVPGITIMDNRFLVVRGLAQRYNNVWLNNAATPSSEADVKAFSFDIIPSSMIENIMIFKSPAAELPADFSGGFVKISTKNMPDRNGYFVSYGTGFTEATTLGPFRKERGSSTDILGFDNGFRSLPADMPSHLNLYESATNPAIREKITSLGKELNNSWETLSATAIPDQKVLAGVNRRIEKGKLTFGNATAITYSYSNNSDEIMNNDYSIYNFVSDRPSYLNEFIDIQYSTTARTAVMNNTSLYLGSNTKLEFRNLINQSGTSRYSTRNGREWYNNGRYIRSDEIRYMSRLVYTGQLAGQHDLGKDKVVKVDWVMGYAISNKKEPDTRRFRYIRDQVDTTRYMLLFSDQADLSSQSRMWIDLNEATLSGAINLTRVLNINGFAPEIKTGLYFENKGRTFHARNFGYAKAGSSSTFGQTILSPAELFSDSNINLTDGIKLMEVTSLSDSYTASNLQMAAYVSARIPLGQRMNLYSGIRLERNRQELSSYKQGSTVKVDVDRDTINIFPSMNLTYNINETSLIRAAYGMTVNRPEFREIAPFYYVDFELNAGIYGAPHIKQAYIHNFDLRYELYPASGETFTFGAFFKKFLNPIEQVILGNNPTQYSFENVNAAYSAGIEAELRKRIDFIPGMKNFTVVTNSSLISSKVKFAEGSISRDRPLEGQSPFIVNAGLFYENENGLMMSLMYNVIGKRIAAVGRPSPNQWEDIPDIYEMPRNVIDLAFSKMIGKNLEIKGGVKDLLNERITFSQNINTSVNMDVYSNGSISGVKQFKREQITKSYSPGRYFSIGISLKL